MVMSQLDPKYISRELVYQTIDGVTNVKNYLKNFSKPLTSLINDGESVKGVLKVLGFFRVPGSDSVIAKLSMLQDYARVILKDLYKINLDKQIGELYELYLKIDSLNGYVKKLELENEGLREKLRRSK